MSDTVEELEEKLAPIAKNTSNKTPLILDGKYFIVEKATIRTDDRKCNIIAKSIACGKSIKGNLRSTSNFLLHLTFRVLSGLS